MTVDEIREELGWEPKENSTHLVLTKAAKS